MRVAAGLVCVLSLVVGGCGSEAPQRGSEPAATHTSSSRPPQRAPTSPGPVLQPSPAAPPTITISAGTTTVEAHSGSYCWMVAGSGSCADTAYSEPSTLPVVDGPAEVHFTFPVEGWVFDASFRPVDAGVCAHSYSLRAQRTTPGTYRLPAAGPAGDYRVSLFGSGPQGDFSAEFRWRTASAGVVPEPAAYVGIVSTDLDGRIDDGHGLNLSVSGLARTPERASATVTATATNGRSVTVDAGEAQLGCPAAGQVDWWETDGRRSRRIAALGPPPFTYDVTLVLDGVEHHARATWPDDHVDDPFNDDPAPVPLMFDPPLA